MIICQVCGQNFKNNKAGQFTKHLEVSHNISQEDYVILSELSGVEPRCECGYCEERPSFYRGSFLTYASGHKSFKWREEQYLKVHGQPKCLECSSPVNFRRGEPLSYCSFECSGKNAGFSLPKTQDRIKEVVQERYGVDNVSHLESVKSKISEALTGIERSPESEATRKAKSRASKANWKNPAYRTKVVTRVRKAVNTPRMKAVRSRNQKDRWRDPMIREKLLQSLKASFCRTSKLHLKVRDEFGLEDLGFESEQLVGRYFVDELNSEDKVVIEIYGDYVHANPKLYEASDLIRLPGNSYTAQEKWDYDADRISYLEGLGYEVIVVWESDDWDDILGHL